MITCINKIYASLVSVANIIRKESAQNLGILTADLVFEFMIFLMVELVDIRGICWVYDFTKVFQSTGSSFL